MTVDFCALPTGEQPLRLGEWDELFADAVIGTERVEPRWVRAALRPQHEIAARAADLAVRETECCSFFTFTLTVTSGRLELQISVPTGRTAVLDALVGRIDGGEEDDHD